MKRCSRYLVPVLLAVLMAWLLLCTHVAGAIPLVEILRRMAVPVTVFAVSCALLALSGRRGRIVFFILLCIFTLYQFGAGLVEFLGQAASGSDERIVAGTLVYVGLYGGLMSLSCIACLYEFLHTRNRRARVAIAVVFVTAFSAMVFSMSRASWLAFVVASAVIVYRETRFRINFGRKANVIVAAVSLIAVCVMVFLIKPESALARVHIWRMDVRAVTEHPLFGAGSAAEVGAYGDAQAHFFAAKERSGAVKRMADSVSFVYNEFLKFGIQGGLPALLLSIAVYLLALVQLFRKRSEYVYVLIAFGVFSLFSFPLSSISLCSLLALLLADASVEEGRGRLQWSVAAVTVAVCMAPLTVQRVETMCAARDFRRQPEESRRYGKYCPELRYDPDFINLYGSALYGARHFSVASDVLYEGVPFTSQTTYCCMLGSSLDMQGRYDEAEDIYLKAIDMVPTRLAPYYFLIKHYINLGYNGMAMTLRERALAVPYDSGQPETVRIRKEIESLSR